MMTVDEMLFVSGVRRCEDLLFRVFRECDLRNLSPSGCDVLLLNTIEAMCMPTSTCQAGVSRLGKFPFLVISLPLQKLGSTSLAPAGAHFLNQNFILFTL